MEPNRLLAGAAFVVAGVLSAPAEEITALETPESVQLRLGELPLVTYWKQPSELPPGVDEIYEREAYLHPVRTLTGQAATGDFPPDHLHHRGIFFAWTKTRFDGGETDFWNLHKDTGHVEHREVLELDAEGGRFRVRRAHVTNRTPSTEVLTEEWEVSGEVIEPGKAWALDIRSAQQAAGERPLELLEYHYGGMGFRAPDPWKAEGGCTVLTSLRDGRATANHTSPHWVAMSGEVEGVEVTVVAMGSPQNFRFPQPVRVHPEMPYFCFTPPYGGKFEIGKEDALVSHYRFLFVTGAAGFSWIDEQWRTYQEAEQSAR